MKGRRGQTANTSDSQEPQEQDIDTQEMIRDAGDAVEMNPIQEETTQNERDDKFEQLFKWLQDKERQQEDEKKQLRIEQEEKERRQVEREEERERRILEQRQKEREEDDLIWTTRLQSMFAVRDNKISKIEEKLDEIINSLQQEVKRQTDGINERIQQNEVSINTRCAVAETQIQRIGERVELMEDQVERVNGNYKDMVEKKIDEVQTRIDYFINQNANEFDIIRANIRNNVSNKTESWSGGYKILPPVFYADSQTYPKRFLKSLKSYLEIMGIDGDISKVKLILRNSLKGEAQIWYSIIEGMCEQYGDFERMFLEQYWGILKQNKLRQNLITGKYYQGDYADSRERYAIKKYNQAIDLEPPMGEKEIINMIANHFDDDIHMHMAARDMNDLQVFLEYLRRIDDVDNRRRRNQNVNVQQVGVHATPSQSDNRHDNGNQDYRSNNGNYRGNNYRGNNYRGNGYNHRYNSNGTRNTRCHDNGNGYNNNNDWRSQNRPTNCISSYPQNTNEIEDRSRSEEREREGNCKRNSRSYEQQSSSDI